MEESYTNENLEHIEDQELMHRFVLQNDEHLANLNEILKKTYSSIIDE